MNERGGTADDAAPVTSAAHWYDDVDAVADVWEPIVASAELDFETSPWNELDEAHRDVVRRARRLADEKLRPWAATWDEEERFPQRSYDLLREAGLNVEHMQNRIFAGGDAAVATIDVAGDVPPDLPARLHAISEVLGSSLIALDPTGTERT